MFHLPVSTTVSVTAVMVPTNGRTSLSPQEYNLWVRPYFMFKMFNPKFICINFHILEFPLFSTVCYNYLFLCYYVTSINGHPLPFMFIKQPRPVPLFTMKFQFDLYKYVISQETIVYV